MLLIGGLGMNSTTLDEIWVPAQSQSTRCVNKNFRPFYNNQSLLDILLEKLIEAFPKTVIGVSTDISDEIAEKYSNHRTVKVLRRPPQLLGNSIIQGELLKHFSESMAEFRPIASEHDNIMVAQCTDPLFFEYKNAFDFYLTALLENSDCSIFASLPVKKQLIRDGICLNGGFGQWHKVTQSLEPIDLVRWSCFLATRGQYLNYGYQMPPNSLPYRSNSHLLDIDTEQDFQVAQVLYEYISKAS